MDLLRDFRYALRMLRKNLLFTAAAVITLGVSTGANTTIFSVVKSVLLNPLPFREPNRLMALWLADPDHGFPKDVFSYPRFEDTRSQSRSFTDVAAYSDPTLNLTGSGEPEQLQAVECTANLPAVLGVRPALGSLFVGDEHLRGERVVLLSNGFWRRRYGSDPGIIGRNILLNGEAYAVLGVLPADFAFPDRSQDVMLPIRSVNSGLLTQRGALWLNVVGRLKPGISAAQAVADLDALNQRFGERYPNTDVRSGTVVVPLSEEFTLTVRRELWLLMAAVSLVVLIACSNIAGMQMARASGREQEVAIRFALGASRGTVARQMVVENVVLFVIGGLVGILLSLWTLPLLARFGPEAIRRFDDIHLEWGGAAFGLILCLAAGVVFGWIPALRALSRPLALSRRAVISDLKTKFGRQLLVMGQLALAVILLTGSSLLIRSFVALQRLDLGFDPESLAAIRLNLPQSRYPNAAVINDFYSRLEQGLEANPGVESVGLTRTLLLSALPNATGDFTIERGVNPTGIQQPVTVNPVSNGYFEAIREHVVRGRAFTSADTANSLPVAIINETMARHYWPGVDPIGQRFKLGSAQSNAPWLTIVGVVADTRRAGLQARSWLESYQPLSQGASRSLTILIRSSLDLSQITALIRSEVSALDREQPIASLTTVDRMLAERSAPRRFNTLLLILFAFMSLLLAAVGIYGVVSQVVATRTREIGVRIALGASRAGVVRLVAGRLGFTMCAGTLAGSALAALAAGAMRSFLFGISSLDPLSFVAGPAILLIIGSIAATVPLRRALRVDPAIALRGE